MISRLILTIGSFFFLILLLVTYFGRSMTLKLSNRLYRYLITLVSALLIFEIIATITFTLVDIYIVYEIMLRINWFIGLILFMVVYMYVYVYINDINYSSVLDFIKKDKLMKFVVVFTIIYSIVFFILPFKTLTEEDFSFIPGTGAYFVLGYVAFSVLMSLKEAIFNKKATKTIRYSLIILLVLLIIAVILQRLFSFSAYFGMVATIELFIIYFLIENPDLRYIEEIDQMKNQIERSSRAKSDFLSNMSHEIRSPMNAIIGFSETILSDNENYDPARTLNDLNHIKSSSKNLLDIINNILDISKIETGSDTIENKEYSLKNHIIDWTGIVNTRLGGKNIKFVLDVDKEIPSKLYGDATKIFQVVLNILTNSVKYTEVGRIKMTISKEMINNKTVKLKFKVSDTGFGIKKEDYDKVFQKFSRLDSAKTNEIEGTGLGLVLTKKYANLMGGDIWFENEYGAGTTFYFNVPQAIIDITPMGDINETIEIQSNKALLNCTNLKALVVDDDELNLKVTERLLKAYNFTVETSSSPEDIIYRFKMGEYFNIIFLDHVMPMMDGVELMKILKGLNGYQIPPIVALTANAITGVREYYLKEGFDEYISKPIDINELDKIINKYFNRNNRV